MKREPLFNIPTIVIAVLAALALVHAVRELVLSAESRAWFDVLFAFTPRRYDGGLLPGGGLPGGAGAQIWSFVTYAFIHADLTHLGFNAVWLLPFGSAVARRFGPLRFLLFFAVTAAAGALAQLFTHGGQDEWVVGASAAISGLMAAAMRFAFQRGGPIGMWRSNDEQAYRVAAIPLTGMLRDPRVLAFLLVWFGLNALFGLGSFPITGEDQPVAWQAHIGGFLAGLLLFAIFDPVPSPRSENDPGATRH